MEESLKLRRQKSKTQNILLSRAKVLRIQERYIRDIPKFLSLCRRRLHSFRN